MSPTRTMPPGRGPPGFPAPVRLGAGLNTVTGPAVSRPARVLAAACHHSGRRRDAAREPGRRDPSGTRTRMRSKCEPLRPRIRVNPRRNSIPAGAGTRPGSPSPAGGARTRTQSRRESPTRTTRINPRRNGAVDSPGRASGRRGRAGARDPDGSGSRAADSDARGP